MSHHARVPKIPAADDSVRILITETAKERGETLASLSKKLKRNPAYMQQFVKRKIPKRLPETVRHQLAYLLQVEESRLRGASQMTETESSTKVADAIHGQFDGFTAAILRQIPTYSHATGGPRGEFKFTDDNRAGDVPAPPMLANVRDAYAMYMVGDTMKPRYHAGEIVYVHPGLPVRDGDYLVLQIIDNNSSGTDSPPLAMICQQVNKTTFLQINPHKEIKLDADQIVARHRIVLAG